MALAFGLAGFHPVEAAHAAVGTQVANVEMPTLEGATARPLADSGVTVLLFFRPNQERSLRALRELAPCQAALAAKRVRVVGVVPDSESSASVAALLREAGLVVPALIDTGDALYGSLGIALHPVVVVVDARGKLAAFEPFRSIDFCPVVGARIRHTLGEISDDELREALNPPKAAEGGDEQVARRYRALAEMQFTGGNHDRALESVRKSIERNPQWAPAHSLMGEILAAKGDCRRATEAFTRALAIDTGNATAQAGVERCKSPR